MNSFNAFSFTYFCNFIQEWNAIYNFKSYILIGQTPEEGRKIDRGRVSKSKWVSMIEGESKIPKLRDEFCAQN